MSPSRREPRHRGAPRTLGAPSSVTPQVALRGAGQGHSSAQMPSPLVLP